MHWKKAKSDHKTHHLSFMKYMATFGEPLLKPHAHNHSRSTQFLISTPVTLTQTPPSHPMHGHITHLFFSSSFHLHYFIPIHTIKSSNTQLCSFSHIIHPSYPFPTPHACHLSPIPSLPTLFLTTFLYLSLFIPISYTLQLPPSFLHLV